MILRIGCGFKFGARWAAISWLLLSAGGGCGTLSGDGAGSTPGRLREDVALVNAQAVDILPAAEAAPEQADAGVIGEQEDSALIRQGDQLRVTVWMRDRITPLKGFPVEAEAPESGHVFIPHMGMVNVVGVSTGVLQDTLRRHFAGMLQDALVIVERTRTGALGSGQKVGTLRGAVSLEDIPQRFVVMGDIAQPGVYSLGPNLRLREAIALAGGLDRRRARRTVYLVRGSQDKPEVLRVNMGAILYGKDLSANVMLQHNDAIYVPTKRLWRMADFVNTLLSPIMGVRDTLWMYDRLR